MKLIIDNFDNLGARDYTNSVEGPDFVTVHRHLNRPVEMRATLVSSVSEFIVPAGGARVQVIREDGTKMFTGYLGNPPEHEYLGWTNTGPGYRYKLIAVSDEFLLDRKTVPVRAPSVGRTAGAALRLLTDELFPGEFDLSGIDDVAALASWEVDPQKQWSQLASAIALEARARYRVEDGAISFKAIPVGTHEVSEGTPGLSPADLQLRCLNQVINDITVIGKIEPQSYVKDWFCGDGLSLRFDLSQVPFTRRNRVLLDEEFKGAWLDPVRWTISGDKDSVAVGAGKLQIQSHGADGSTVVRFSENIELGGALVCQHGQVNLTAASDGIVGGLYIDPIRISNCVAGFRVTPTADQSAIQALINGGLTGPVIVTAAGHQYALTTRLYASEIYRSNVLFHSSTHRNGSGRGGETIRADMRVVLEVRDVDPGNYGSSSTTVLYDGLLYNSPEWCVYALFNGGDLHCDVAFTRIFRPVDAEVRSALPGEGYRTRLAGALSDGAECSVSESPALYFFSAFVPAANEKIVVSYRGSGRAVAHIHDPSSIENTKKGNDNGVIGKVCEILSPPPRTSIDCTNAALAVLDDIVREGWTGEYKIWSDFLPSHQDVYPGDAVDVSAPSRGAQFRATVREVQIQVRDIANDRAEYSVRFADDQAEPIALALRTTAMTSVPPIDSIAISEVRSALPPLTAAAVADVTSTTISIDTGMSPPSGSGIEVRRSDGGWGFDNDRNLIGRFGTRVITLPRLSRIQNYFLRLYDSSSPPNYSEFSTAIHVNYPL